MNNVRASIESSKMPTVDFQLISFRIALKMFVKQKKF